jgi:hypothetical protein
LAENKKAPARHKAEDDYLLTLKLFCGKCNTHMVGESGMGTSRVYRYYKCANTKKVHICDKKAVRKDWIEDLVVEKAMKVLHDDKLIEYLMNAIEQGIITDTTKDRLAQLESKKKEIEIAILQEKIKKPFLTKEQIQFGIERFRNLDITTLEGKRRLIDGFVNSIYLYDDKFDITFNFKDGTQTVFFSEIEATKNSDIKSLGAPIIT